MKTHWKMLLMGVRGSGFFNHSSMLRTSSWQAHLMGRSWWYICGILANGSQACFEDIVETGEVVFYGQDYFHETQKLETPTLTLTDTVIDEYNFEAFNDRLWEKCTGNRATFMFSAALCDALDVCYERMYEQCEWEYM